mgnify:CR=1 FL=1
MLETTQHHLHNSLTRQGAPTRVELRGEFSGSVNYRVFDYSSPATGRTVADVFNISERRKGLLTSPFLQRHMTAYSGRLVLAVGLAGIAGVLHGLGPGIPHLVDSAVLAPELSPAEIGPIVSLVSILSTVVTIGIFFAGFWWADQADIPAAYGRFAVSLFVAAFAGHSVGFLPLFLLMSDQSVITTVGLFGVLTVSLIAVPVPGLAGGAISQYRSVTNAN